jgi:ectoine hydroxylase-related dioxygenase (phytanoyl-CoA dioxygenase family)
VQQILTRTRDQALSRVLSQIDALGLNDRLIELETQGYTVLPRVLSDETIARAKAAILRRAERKAGRPIDPATATAADFNGMQYIPYLLYDDAVFEEILMEPAPLALVTYLLGESCLLSSMGCHFRGPGGAPLMLHSDNGNGMPAPFTDVSMVANVNYALTPYSREAGALAMIPGSHKLRRSPTAHENFTAPGLTAADLAAKARAPGALDAVEWKDPPGAVCMDINPGDAVIWHGNTWHGGFRRELAGVRMNLSAYFCRQPIQTQERHGDPARQAVLDRHANAPRFAVLLGAKQPYGWREEGPDYALMAQSPRGLYD